MIGVFVAFIMVVYGRTIYMSLPYVCSIVTFCSAIASFIPKFSFFPEEYKDYEF